MTRRSPQQMRRTTSAYRPARRRSRRSSGRTLFGPYGIFSISTSPGWIALLMGLGVLILGDKNQASWLVPTGVAMIGLGGWFVGANSGSDSWSARRDAAEQKRWQDQQVRIGELQEMGRRSIR